MGIRERMGNGMGMGRYFRDIAATQQTTITILITCIVVTILLTAVLVFLLIKTKKKSKNLDKLRQDFISNISHELRTPITVIKGSLEALYDEVVTEPEMIKEYYCQMLSETKFLQRLVSDLLDLSRLQNMNFEIVKTEINLCDCLKDSVRSVQTIAGNKGIVINIEKDNPKCRIYADYGRIRQMLIIVLDNAVKFSREKSKIDIQFKNNILSITDYGIGIEKSELPYVFDRFHKTKGESNKDGTGLGLSIAKQIADRHGIKITVQSINNEKTIFKFEV